jgi:hypothetical protein
MNGPDNTSAGVDPTKTEMDWSVSNSLQLKDLVPKTDQTDQNSRKVPYTACYRDFWGNLVGLVGHVANSLACKDLAPDQSFGVLVGWSCSLDHRKRRGWCDGQDSC